MKSIALLYSGANSERQREKIKELHNSFSKRDAAIYVLSCYDAMGSADKATGDQNIYMLASEKMFDGCVVDDNINVGFTNDFLINGEVLRGKPCVFSNANISGKCCVSTSTYEAVFEMLSHLITVHGCKKINYVANFEWLSKRYTEYAGTKAYKDVCEKFGLPFEEKRLVNFGVSLEKAHTLPQIFENGGIDDCDAVFLNADINAIGLCDAYLKMDVKVPDDIKIMALRRSGNAAGFKPDISGGASPVDAEAETIATLLYDCIEKGISEDYRTYPTGGIYGESCGCNGKMRPFDAERCRFNIFNKIASGDQISAMMTFCNSLEKVTSLEEYADVVKIMYNSLGCKNYAICLNKDVLPYILNETEEYVYDSGNPFGDTLFVVAGMREGKAIDGLEFERKRLVPFEVKAGDVVTIMPITHLNRTFGYTVLYNDLQPYELINYRICYATLGSSFESLRRQIRLRKTITELDIMRITDHMTGLFNRASMERFKEEIAGSEEYTVVMIDMDNLKKINDAFGHEEGNRAITILAGEIKRVLKANFRAVRYGGDEFVILCPGNVNGYWDKMKKEINSRIEKEIKALGLPYFFGASIGSFAHTVADNLEFEAVLELADECMYQDKQRRKAGRTD